MFKLFNRKNVRGQKPVIVAAHHSEVSRAAEDKNRKHLTLMHGLAMHLQTKEWH